MNRDILRYPQGWIHHKEGLAIDSLSGQALNGRIVWWLFTYHQISMEWSLLYFWAWRILPIRGYSPRIGKAVCMLPQLSRYFRGRGSCVQFARLEPRVGRTHQAQYTTKTALLCLYPVKFLMVSYGKRQLLIVPDTASRTSEDECKWY